MKTVIVRMAWMATALLALAGCERKVAVDTAAIAEEIGRGGQEMAAAYNAGDIDTVVAKFAPDAVFMPPQAEATSGSEAVRKLWTDGSAALREAGLAVVLDDGDSVNASADIGWLSGKYHYRNAADQDVPGGYYLQAWENRDGKWLVVRMMWTESQPPAAAPAAEAPAGAPEA